MFHFGTTFICTLFRQYFNGTIFKTALKPTVKPMVFFFTQKQKLSSLLIWVDSTSSWFYFLIQKSAKFHIWRNEFSEYDLLCAFFCLIARQLNFCAMCMTKWFCQWRWSLETVWQNRSALWSNRSIYNYIRMHATHTTSSDHSNKWC